MFGEGGGVRGGDVRVRAPPGTSAFLPVSTTSRREARQRQTEREPFVRSHEPCMMLSKCLDCICTGQVLGGVEILTSVIEWDRFFKKSKVLGGDRDIGIAWETFRFMRDHRHSTREQYGSR